MAITFNKLRLAPHLYVPGQVRVSGYSIFSFYTAARTSVIHVLHDKVLYEEIMTNDDNLESNY